MELNKEQIIKQMQEWCDNMCENACLKGEQLNGKTHTCEICFPNTVKNALSLINELTEENERLTLKVAAYQVKDKLLSNQLDDKCDMCIARERADTVRQMQEELKKTFSALCKGEMGDLYRIIDQIAKEMLEGKK